MGPSYHNYNYWQLYRPHTPITQLNQPIKTEISQYLSLHNSIAKLHFLIMASDNEEALLCHVTEMEPNHWIVTVSHDSLLAWNSIMAQINRNPGGFPLSRIWHIWISAAEGEQACIERIQSLSKQCHVNQSDLHLPRNNPQMRQTAAAGTKTKTIKTFLLEDKAGHQKPWKSFEQIMLMRPENKRYNQARALLTPPPPLRSLCWE